MRSQQISFRLQRFQTARSEALYAKWKEIWHSQSAARFLGFLLCKYGGSRQLFMEDLSGHFLLQKTRRKNPVVKSTEKFQQLKSRNLQRKMILPNMDPKFYVKADLKNATACGNAAALNKYFSTFASCSCTLKEIQKIGQVQLHLEDKWCK